MEIKLKNITKKYIKNKETTIALNNIDLKFESPGLYLISGRSGSGKTTLLNMIAGFDMPTSGEIINNFGDNSSSFIFQDYQLINYLTIYENLKYVCDLFKIDPSLISDYANKYFINDILNHYPNEVSGGEKQRVAIIRAFLINRPLILCDEPTGNLDEENALIIAKALKEESKNHIIIVVSHDRDLFTEYCDQEISMSKGQIISKTELKQENTIKVSSFGQLHFGLKNQLYLMKKFMKKNILKHVLIMITLIVTFFLSFSALSTVSNSYNKVLNNSCKDQGINQIDFYLKGSNDTTIVQPYSQLIAEADKYNASAIYYDFGFMRVGKMSPKRTYIGDSTTNKIIVGSNSIKDNEILISDYVALKTGKSFDELLDSYYCEYKIVGIYDTGFYAIGKELTPDQIDNLQIDSNYIDKLYSSMYVNRVTFESNLKNKDEFDAEIRLSGYTTINYISKTCEYSILYGDDSELLDNEIGISLALANRYAENSGIAVEELIGKDIDIQYVLKYNQYIGTTYDTKTYTVKYICGGSSQTIYTVLSSNNFDEAALLYNYNMFNYTNGISIENYNTKRISKVLNSGYTDDIAISEVITSGVDWLNTLKYLEIGIAVLLLITTITVLVNFIHTIFEKEKGVQGLLVSFGASKKKVVQMYLTEIIMLIIVSIFISLLLEIPFIFGINAILTNFIGSFGILYFESLSIVYIAIILIALITFAYLLLLKQMKKKEVIDIIYQR